MTQSMCYRHLTKSSIRKWNTKCLKHKLKTRGHVSVAKKDMWHTSVLFTGTTKSPFSIPHISITTRLIYIKFTYFIPSIYTTLIYIPNLNNKAHCGIS